MTITFTVTDRNLLNFKHLKLNKIYYATWKAVIFSGILKINFETLHGQNIYKQNLDLSDKIPTT